MAISGRIRPDQCLQKNNVNNQNMVTIKTAEEIELLRSGGRHLAGIIAAVAALAVPGATTAELEEEAREKIASCGGRPSFLGYHSGARGEAYPAALCLSLNDEIVHAPPFPSRVLKQGDILSIDAGLEYPAAWQNVRKGMFTDAALTVFVGKPSAEARKLVEAASEALKRGIREARPGRTLSDIGGAIEDYARSKGFSVVRELVGHGVGYGVHEAPQIPNYRVRGEDFDNVVLEPGMILAIEPMITSGGWQIRLGSDPFTIKTRDGSLAAHFEHTVAVTAIGPEILTLA